MANRVLHTGGRHRESSNLRLCSRQSARHAPSGVLRARRSTRAKRRAGPFGGVSGARVTAAPAPIQRGTKKIAISFRTCRIVAEEPFGKSSLLSLSFYIPSDKRCAHSAPDRKISAQSIQRLHLPAPHLGLRKMLENSSQKVCPFLCPQYVGKWGKVGIFTATARVP
jgi:hypothetical protein